MKRILLYLPISLILFFTISCAEQQTHSDLKEDEKRVKVGAETLIDSHLGELQNQRIGLVMNPTARIGETHVLDTLLALDVNIIALFAPEHGFRGEAGAGEKIEDGTDQATGLPVFSLYGDTRKPSQEMLDSVDLLIFDMQDVGARFYTYIATLGLVIEAAAEANKPVWVLDRPNPAGGDYVSGWVLEEEFESFVGPYPIPIAHGLTMGEIATMMVGEEWIHFETEPDIRVLPMTGWQRSMKWPDTGLTWVPPSPNLPTFEHAYLYLGNVFYEGTTLSEGRGTRNPFLTLGDPSVTISDEQLESLQKITDAVSVEQIQFTPESIPGVAPNPKHLDRVCSGIETRIVNYDFDPVRTGLEIFRIMLNAAEDYEIKSFLYLLAGTRAIDEVISGEINPLTTDFELDDFLLLREPYLIY